ncbi:hypothetical protein [Streptomyces monomycini]|uniref:hypothetical protein n=1 Tax=Streptomyces monomycini TaxID=371720 RepID=UPI0004AB41EB|nr:hypothetical protein [Streptomyces monomycini]
MFSPKYPSNPTPPSVSTPRMVDGSAPARRFVPQASVSTGAVVIVLVGGVVLIALLAAVAVSAVCTAVTAMALRSLLRDQHRH